MTALALGACSSAPPSGTIGHVEGYAGAVVADEPRAVLVARDVLSAGGSAGDAAVALYFTLAVTLPSRAGLGGGGVCLAHDKKKKISEVLDFIPPASADPRSETVTRPTAVPLAARGMFALHAKYGRFRWEELLRSAENLARFGNPASRALVSDLNLVAGPLFEDAEARRIFGKPNGQPVGEGDQVVQFQLAAVISRIRQRGVGELYVGAGAKSLAQAVTLADGTLTEEDLRAALPKWVDSLQVKQGNETVYFPPPPAAGGAMAAQVWSSLAGQKRYDRTNAEERAHLWAETSKRAFVERGTWMRADGGSPIAPKDLLAETRIAKLSAGYAADKALPTGQLNVSAIEFPENPAQTGFAVFDRDGNAVVCGLTMNNLFGAGRIAPGTGILLAAAPGRAGRGPFALGPMLAINNTNQDPRFAAVASGGAPAPLAMLQVAALATIDEKPLSDALAAKRIHHAGLPDVTLYEADESPAKIAGLTRRGHTVAETPALGRVNAIRCPQGLHKAENTCQAAPDPRGHGLGMVVGEKK